MCARSVCQDQFLFCLMRRRPPGSPPFPSPTLFRSLGGVESLIEVPLAMTHGSVKGTKLAPPAALVRLSVGIEAVDDLIADLAQAMG